MKQAAALVLALVSCSTPVRTVDRITEDAVTPSPSPSPLLVTAAPSPEGAVVTAQTPRPVRTADPPTQDQTGRGALLKDPGSVVGTIHAVFGAHGHKAVIVARCESGLNPRAVSSTGKFRALYQWDAQTWRSVGGTGDPINASVLEQVQRAHTLFLRRGWVSPWPTCGRRVA